MFQVWMVGGTSSFSIDMNICFKSFEEIDNALTCKASLDEVRDNRELVKVPDDI